MLGQVFEIIMANNAFDIPFGVLVDDEGNITPTWDQWTNRIQSIASAAQQSGTTAQRPTSGLWIGRQFWDSTLSKPVYVSAVRPTVWRDATGAIV